MSGQYMLEQTFHLPPAHQYDLQASPLAILMRCGPSAGRCTAVLARDGPIPLIRLFPPPISLAAAAPS